MAVVGRQASGSRLGRGGERRWYYSAAELVAVMGRWSDGYCDSVNWQTGVCWLEAEVVGRRSCGGRGGEGVKRFRCGQVSRPPRWWAAV